MGRVGTRRWRDGDEAGVGERQAGRQARVLKGLITSIFPPKRFARWSSCTLDGTCFDLSLRYESYVEERRAAGLCGDTIGALSPLLARYPSRRGG